MSCRSGSSSDRRAVSDSTRSTALRWAGRCSLLLRLGECGAGSPARRRGNFLLRGQKKVTKEKALNRIPAPQAHPAPCNSRTAAAQTRAAALSRLSLSPASPLGTAARLTRGCTPGSPEQPTQRRSGAATRAQHPPGRRPSDAVFAFPGEPGVQPALTGVKVRALVLVIGTAARAQRLASAHQTTGCFRAPLPAPSGWFAVQRLFFGDFLLAPQKKVTRPPGRTPGTTLGTTQAHRGASQESAV
jgi:hypothetical protein